MAAPASTPGRSRMIIKSSTDSPLGERSNLSRREGSPTKSSKSSGSKYSGSVLSRKDREDVLPNAGGDMHIVKDWTGPDAKTGGSKSNLVPGRGDRYLPNRDLSRSSDLHAPLCKDNTGSSLSDSMQRVSISDTEEQNRIETNIARANLTPTDLAGGSDNLADEEEGQRILSFSAAPPSSAFSGSDSRSRYAAARPKPNLPGVPSSLISGGRRRIATTAYKTLDAPGVLEDFYLNLMHWSTTNLLAIALGSIVYVWNADTAEATQLCDLEESPDRVGGRGLVHSVRWDAEGSHLAVGTDRGFVQIWDIQAGSRARTLKPNPDGGADNSGANVLAWAPDGTLNSGYASGLIREYDVRSRDATTRNLERAHTAAVCGMEWRKDSALLATGGNDNVVKVWDRRSDTAKMRKENHAAGVKALAWCPWNSQVLATGGGTVDSTIHFWNVTAGTRTQSIKTGAQVTSLHWSTSYKELVSTHGIPAFEGDADDGAINLWSYPACKKVHNITQCHDNARILHTSLSPDGQTLATVAADENLKFWRVFEVQGDSDKTDPSQMSGRGAAIRSLR